MKTDTVNIGICWYKEEQWERLKEIVSDPDNIEETYQQWRKDAEKTLNELKANRVNIKKAWPCSRRRISSARDPYAEHDIRTIIWSTDLCGVTDRLREYGPDSCR